MLLNEFTLVHGVSEMDSTGMSHCAKINLYKNSNYPCLERQS